MFLYSLLLSSFLSLSLAYPTHPTCRCQPFHSTFPPSSLSNSNDPNFASKPFVALTPRSSYEFTNGGLELYLDKPAGVVESKDGIVNSKVAEGATINSTFCIDSGKVTFTVSAPAQAGVITAMIAIDATENPPNTPLSETEPHQDEIDIEILGGDPSHWQSNIFKVSRADSDPHYGVFYNKHGVTSIEDEHSYSISFDGEQIVWSLDGEDVRTMRKDDTYIKGVSHFPQDAMRLQMAIWDGSGAQGTSKWSKGPIQWGEAPDRMVATLKSVTVEC